MEICKELACRDEAGEGGRESGDKGEKGNEIIEVLGHILNLERFKKGNNLSRFTLENIFWEECGEWIRRGLRMEAGSPRGGGGEIGRVC